MILQDVLIQITNLLENVNTQFESVGEVVKQMGNIDIDPQTSDGWKNQDGWKPGKGWDFGNVKGWKF